MKFKDSRMRVYSLDIEEKLGVEETKDVEGLIKRLFKKSVGSREVNNVSSRLQLIVPNSSGVIY